MAQDLTTLQYPRHLHKGPSEYLRVESADEAATALKDGWTVEVDPAAKAEPEKKTDEANGSKK